MTRDDVIRVREGKSSYLAVVIKVLNGDYVSAIKADGEVMPHLYSGDAEMTGLKVSISDILSKIR